MTRVPRPEQSIHHLQTIAHHPPAAQVNMSRDRAIIVVRGIFRLAEARHWKLCTQPRLSERPSSAFLTVINLAIYFLTPTTARMMMKIGKTIWTLLRLPGTMPDRQIPTLSRWFRITIARLAPGSITR
ncbi:hypothetical protein PILCRDRAFT_501991 [Piloderma croceum F 1598]|uniref:Uncharacterized protein n=1 Tax=Piloderma croceum (strain F 1598) TaxID=765440 RepID=A0A0C3F9W5_PILCF|nr:hypothetical protein PILCRDRAFT_501991 [Piloderma croceum F 1598]